MKIIIKESKIDMLMTEFLDNWVASKSVSRHDKFIIFHTQIDNEEWEDVMEYDGSDGRLWINQKIYNLLNDLFGKGHNETLEFIGKWFENKYGKKVIFVE
jgi:hypothetical protein